MVLVKNKSWNFKITLLGQLCDYIMGLESWSGRFTAAPERSRSASILCRSLRFRVSQKGPIKLCQRGEWPCLWVRSAVKVFRSNLKLLRVAARRVQRLFLFAVLSRRTLTWRNSQPAGLRWHWQLESKQLAANQLTAATSSAAATSRGANPSKTS